MSSELINAVKLIAVQKNIDEDTIMEALKLSLIAACRKNFGLAQNIDVNIDKNSGDVKVIAYKKVVEKVDDSRLEISLEDAKNIDARYKLEDMVEIIITPKNFGRIAAQTAKQVISQKFLEIERNNLFNKFDVKKGKIITGIVRGFEYRNIIINLGDIETILPEKEQIPGEIFNVNDRIKLYVIDVKRFSKGISIFVSRTNPNFIRCLFELEIPEISAGIVKIVDIARDPGKRSKVAVTSQNDEVEAIGSCVGENSCRINTISSEINNEKIDLVNWHENIEDYIRSALSPAKIKEIHLNKNKTEALIIVDENQVSLVIGKGGQNVKLAAKLVGIRLNVKTPAQLEGEELLNNI